MTQLEKNTAIVDVSRDDERFEIFTCLANAEHSRRSDERRNLLKDGLAELEANYFGPEVGTIRRAFNKKMMARMKSGGRLLDYGCGGAWWKEDYWPHFDEVYACDVDNSALGEIAEAFPEVRLWWTRNGLIDTDERFDVVLSSSVLGYILPEQGRHHVACAFDLLKEGGQLVLTRVLAFDLSAFLRSRRLVDLPGVNFAYHYKKAELVTLLRESGFEDITYVDLGVRIPFLSWQMNQRLYQAVPGLMTRLLPKVFPFLRIQHMLTATKPKPREPVKKTRESA